MRNMRGPRKSECEVVVLLIWVVSLLRLTLGGCEYAVFGRPWKMSFPWRRLHVLPSMALVYRWYTG
jgi:hypothetical protein